MADIYDQAEATEQLFLNVALSHRKPELKAKGTCHWCLAPVSGDAHFCDADCRDDYQKDKNMRGESGQNQNR